MQWNYERVHHFRWNVRGAVFLFERAPSPPPPPPRFPRFISSVRNFISRLSTVEQLVTRDTIQRCTMPRPITMLTTLRARARAPLWNWIYRGPFLTLKFFSGTGREKNRAYRDFHRSLETERSVALFFPCFLFRSLFPPRPLFPSPCNSLFARLTAIISSF